MHHDTSPDLVKPLVISTLIILAVGGGGVALALTVKAARPMAQVAIEPVGATVTLPNGEVVAASPRSPEGEDAGSQDKRVKRRLAYASEVERRYRARELPVVAQVTGNHKRIFTFRWTLQPNPDQLRLMEHAEPLYGELKDHGFTRVEMLSFQAEKLLWYKDL